MPDTPIDHEGEDPPPEGDGGKKSEEKFAKPGDPLVKDIEWAPAAGIILAGHSDGAAAAIDNHVAPAGSRPSLTQAGESAIGKHAGKVFGGCCIANVSIRNGLLRWILPLAPPDNKARGWLKGERRLHVLEKEFVFFL